MKYVILLNCDTFKYDLKILCKFGLSCISKVFNDPSLIFPLLIHTHPKPITFWIKN